MKLNYSKTTIIILIILISNLMYSQVPSINQVKSFSKEQKSLIIINQNASIKSIDTIETINKKNIPDSKAHVTEATTKLEEEIQKFKLDSIKLSDTKKENQRLTENITNLKSLIDNYLKLELEKNKEIDTLESNLKKFENIVKKQNEDISKQNKKVEEQNELVKNQDVKIQKLETKVQSEKKYEAQNYIDYYEKAISEKNEELNKLIHKQSDETTKVAIDAVSKEIKKCEEEIEKLKKDKNKEVTSKSYSWFLPTRNNKNRKYFFHTMYNNKDSKTKFLNSFGVNGNEYGISGQSELITDNISFLRLAFGTVISASNKETQEDPALDETAIEALDRLVNGGGNFYLETILPFLTTIDRNNDDLTTLYSYFSVKAATDIKGYGNDIDTSTGNGSAGLYLYLGFSSENREFNFFLQGNANYSMGSKEFYKNLAIEHNNGFFNGKLIAGLTLKNNFRFTANFLTFGSEPSLRREKITLGFQFLP